MAKLWWKSLRNITKLVQLSHHSCTGINIADHLAIFLTYLPTSCTDAFKESLDFLQMIKSKLDGSTVVVFAGDLKVDPGSEGGPCATTKFNEQGQILNQYLRCWGYTSSHLHRNIVPSGSKPLKRSRTLTTNPCTANSWTLTFPPQKLVQRIFKSFSSS